MSLGHLFLVVDPATLGRNLFLIISALILGGFLLILTMFGWTTLRAWIFTARQKRSQAHYHDEFAAEKNARDRAKADSLIHRPR